ncbi:MAG TPA: flagellar basal body P-ring formation chaperone FlgA [Xanthobacteraceae bacterium]|jgi:flagella basal body P-ring formation protein FlgA|nr:flagellar basal body P-ring formation chaperone FlgA [Xanthobacteraceae bacterium]
MLRISSLAISFAIIAQSAIAQVISTAAPAMAPLAARPAALPALRREVTIASDLVRIGDLVENAGAVSSIPVFRAPDLGQIGTLQSYRVLEAVAPHGVLNLDTHGITEVVVKRAARIISAKDVEASVVRAVAMRAGIQDSSNLAVNFDRDVQPIYVEPTATGALQIARFAYDRSGRFDITFDLPGSAALKRITLRYTGAAIDAFEVAVPTRTLARGDIIKAADILIERRPRSEFAGASAVPTTDVIGLAARRPVRAGQPLREADLMKPEIVHRGESVTLIYEIPGVALTAQGKAVDAGAEGDIVAVLNVQSKRAVQGMVTGPGRVTITTASSQLANASLASAAQSESGGTLSRGTQ